MVAFLTGKRWGKLECGPEEKGEWFLGRLLSTDSKQVQKCHIFCPWDSECWDALLGDDGTSAFFRGEATYLEAKYGFIRISVGPLPECIASCYPET